MYKYMLQNWAQDTILPGIRAAAGYKLLTANLDYKLFS